MTPDINKNSPRQQEQQTATPSMGLEQFEKIAYESLRVLPGLLSPRPNTNFTMPFELLGNHGDPIGLQYAKEFLGNTLISGRLELPGDTLESDRARLKQNWTSMSIRGQYPEQLVQAFNSAMDGIIRLREAPTPPSAILQYNPLANSSQRVDEASSYIFSGPADAISYISRQAASLSSALRWEKESPLEIPDELNAFNVRSVTSRIIGANELRAYQRNAQYGRLPGFDSFKPIKENLQSAASLVEAFHLLDTHAREFRYDPTTGLDTTRLPKESAEKLINLIWAAASKSPPASEGSLIDITSSLSHRGLALLGDRLAQHIGNDRVGERFRLLLTDTHGTIHHVYGEKLAEVTNRVIERLISLDGY